MRRITFLWIVLMGLNMTVPAQGLQGNLQKTSVYSNVLGESRDLMIYVPGGYSQSFISYPVLYVLDGEQNFSTVVEVVNSLVGSHSLPPHIVVGITNTDRMRDMTTENKNLHKFIYPTRGGAGQFLQALEKEIIPHVERYYRARSKRVITGHSFSGLFCIYLLMNQPDLFDGYLIFSPNLWWDNHSLTQQFDAFVKGRQTLNKKLYLAIGDEGKQQQQSFQNIRSALKEAAPGDLKWKAEVLEKETHFSVLRNGSPKGLAMMFDDYRYPTAQELEEGGIVRLEEYRRRILLYYGQEVKLPYSLLLEVGNDLRLKGKYAEAISFYRESADSYPEKAEAFYNLGYTYEKIQDWKSALACYVKASQKDPGRYNYEKELVRLRSVAQDSLLMP